MAQVRLVDVEKRYGDTVAVDHVSADIADGEFITLARSFRVRQDDDAPYGRRV